MSAWICADHADVLLHVKVVPGARREHIVGPLGDRLKIRVAAPPEGGKANDAVCRLLAHALGVKPGDVTLERGGSSPEKTLRIRGMSVVAAARALAPMIPPAPVPRSTGP